MLIKNKKYNTLPSKQIFYFYSQLLLIGKGFMDNLIQCEYSGDPNSGHLVNRTIQLADFTLLGSLSDKINRASE